MAEDDGLGSFTSDEAIMRNHSSKPVADTVSSGVPIIALGTVRVPQALLQHDSNVKLIFPVVGTSGSTGDTHRDVHLFGHSKCMYLLKYISPRTLIRFSLLNSMPSLQN